MAYTVLLCSENWNLCNPS